MIFREKQHQQIRDVALVLFSFLLPLSPRMATWLAVLWAILWLVGLQPFRYSGGLRRSWLYPVLLFVSVAVLGYFRSPYPESAAASLETGMSLLAFPLLLAFSPEGGNVRLFQQVRNAFLVGCTLAMLICLGYGLMHVTEQGWAAISYKELGSPLRFHPTYFALYLNFGCLLAAESIRKAEAGTRRHLAFILLSFFFILLLAARMQLLIFLFLAAIELLAYMYGKGRLRRGLLILAGSAVLLSGLIWAVPVTRQRLLRAVEQMQAGETGGNVRTVLWEVATESWLERPVMGHGTGSVPEVLVPMYQERGCTECLNGPLNAHNQYLQTAVELGSIGLLLWLVLLLYPLFQSGLRRNRILLLFLLLFALSLLTESMLATQRGMMFFGFFYTFLLWRRD